MISLSKTVSYLTLDFHPKDNLPEVKETIFDATYNFINIVNYFLSKLKTLYFVTSFKYLSVKI